jgi:hypothetical protein
VRLVVSGLAITHHGHDVGERYAGPIVLISVEKDTETLEFVRRTEDRALRRALLGEPQRKAITMQVPGAMDLEFELDLDICVSLGSFNIQKNLVFTCQLVAVRGTREAIHPCCDGRSAVRRIYLIATLAPELCISTNASSLYPYLSARTTVSPPKSNQRLWKSESRYGYYSGQHSCSAARSSLFTVSHERHK